MNEILKTGLEVVALLCTVIPLVVKLIQYVRISIQEKNWGNLISLVMDLMAQAEQKFDIGADRADWVVAMVQASANKINYEISEAELRELITKLCSLSKQVNV